jgi:hypothetical protein
MRARPILNFCVGRYTCEVGVFDKKAVERKIYTRVGNEVMIVGQVKK